MIGYAKIFSTILTSTVWRSSKETRLVWITVLVLSDKDGFLDIEIPGLAHVAGVTVPECEAAMEELSKPDPYSRSPEHDGRRIERTEGGWIVLNKADYRNRMTTTYLKQYWREYKQKQRNGQKRRNEMDFSKKLGTVSKKIGTVSKKTSILSKTLYLYMYYEVQSTLKEVSKYSTPPDESRVPTEITMGDMIQLLYNLYPKHVGKPAAFKAIKKALESNKPDFLLDRVIAYAEARKGCDQAFTPFPSTWFNQERFNDDPSTWAASGQSTQAEFNPWEKK